MITRIKALTHLAAGRTEDGAFVPRTLPGEEVECLEDQSVRILTPSPDRVAAPCRHYKSCGGCAMMHATDAFVAGWKADVVARALTAQGLDPVITGVDTSPPRSRRRAKFSGRRTKKGAIVGFHARASDVIVAVRDCIVLRPSLTYLLPALEELTTLVASRKGEIGLLLTESVAGPDLQIEVEKTLNEGLRIKLADFATRHGFARLSWNDETIVTLRPPLQTFGAALVEPPPGAFLQATIDAQDSLVAAVLEATDGADRVVDLFAGCGTFALPIAARSEVHAVEASALMLKALAKGWRGAAGLKRVTTEARDLFRRPLLADELSAFDAVVIDPPRAGAEAQVTAIGESRVRAVAMVSCNPVTFARDAKILCRSGFAMGPVTVVDQFRWSAHVECVSRFIRP